MLRTLKSIALCSVLLTPLSCWLSDDPGPPSSGYCNNACSKVYNQCGLELKTSSGSALTFGQCLSTCEASGNPASVDACVASYPCSAGTSIASCFNASTPPPTYTCSDSCSKIYDTCGLTLQGPSGPISKSHCIGLCQTDDSRDAKNACVASKSCSDNTGIVACINSGSPVVNDCDSACAEVYNYCQLVVSVGGSDLTESGCVSYCQSATGGSVYSCVESANCSPTALDGCFQ